MSSPRYQQVSQLYETARALTPDERATFLETTCAGDKELGEEVAALLASGKDLLAANSRISHYTIDAPIGAGGMGQVYLATDTRLDRKVAIKVLPEKFTADAERVRRFIQEAKAASALNHPHVITIYDIGVSEAGQFIVMEFVEGQTLRAHTRQPCAPQTLSALGVQIAQALAVAHDTGITHRDIKPDNIMVRTDGYIKVLDFGLARLSPGTAGSEAVTTAYTQPGALIGTVRYMSPEQARSEDVEPPSDIFSLGIVFYEMATGHPPFAGASILDTLNAITSQHPTPPSHWEPGIPSALEQLILQMLAKDGGNRPRAAEVAAALQQFGTRSSIPHARGNRPDCRHKQFPAAWTNAIPRGA
jgi:serine/threonine protein kinase